MIEKPSLPVQVLFVCSRNRKRSLTAELHFKNRPGLVVKSAGTEPSARVRVTPGLIGWAEVIFVMERKHRDILQERFPEEIDGKELICLRIPDEFELNDPVLIEMLEEAVAGIG
jgi:predicted protein tyrosine phosphatase